MFDLKVKFNSVTATTLLSSMSQYHNFTATELVAEIMLVVFLLQI